MYSPWYNYCDICLAPILIDEEEMRELKKFGRRPELASRGVNFDWLNKYVTIENLGQKQPPEGMDLSTWRTLGGRMSDDFEVTVTDNEPLQDGENPNDFDHILHYDCWVSVGKPLEYEIDVSVPGLPVLMKKFEVSVGRAAVAAAGHQPGRKKEISFLNLSKMDPFDVLMLKSPLDVKYDEFRSISDKEKRVAALKDSRWFEFKKFILVTSRVENCTPMPAELKAELKEDEDDLEFDNLVLCPGPRAVTRQNIATFKVPKAKPRRIDTSGLYKKYLDALLKTFSFRKMATVKRLIKSGSTTRQAVADASTGIENADAWIVRSGHIDPSILSNSVIEHEVLALTESFGQLFGTNVFIQYDDDEHDNIWYEGTIRNAHSGGLEVSVDAFKDYVEEVTYEEASGNGNHAIRFR